jgi:hypothetical protein
MPEKIQLERPDQHIKVKINSISNELKAKVATAIVAVVTEIKKKHLS